MKNFLAILLLICSVIDHFTLSFIVQINPIDQVPWIYGNVTLSGGQSECVPFIAAGSIHTIALRYYYNPLHEVLALDTDLLLSIAMTTDLWEIKDCVSYGGYDMQYQYCKHDSYWNTSLWRSTEDGGVEGYVDFSSYELQNDNEYWLFCVSNGWLGSSTKVHYEFSVVFFNSDILVTGYAPGLSPTRSPTPAPTSVDNPQPTLMPTMTPLPTPSYPDQNSPQYLQFRSDTSCPLPSSSSSSTSTSVEIEYLFQLSSQQQRCLLVPTITPIQNLTFSVAKLSVFNNIYSSISDVSLLINELISSSTIQIGGEYPLVDSDQLKTHLKWPQTWNNIDIYNSQWLPITLPTNIYSNDNLNYGYNYQICLVNTYLNTSVSPTSTDYSYLSDDTIWYEGDLILHETIYNCDVQPLTSSPTPMPTSFSTPLFTKNLTELSIQDELLTIFINATLFGGESICLNVEISGKLNYLTLDLSFIGNANSWASDLLVTLESSTSCDQFGGISSNICFDSCNWIGTWPNLLNVDATGDYLVPDAASSTHPSYSHGIRQLCITHANYPSDPVTYTGTLTFNGIYHTSPTNPPSPRIQSHSTSTTQSTLFLVSIIIPFTACCCLLLIFTIYRQRKRLIAYHFHSNDPDSVVIDPIPHHPHNQSSGDLITYSNQIVDADLIYLQEEEYLSQNSFTSPSSSSTLASSSPLTPSSSQGPLLKSSSFTTMKTNLAKIPSFSIPLSNAEKEKKKNSLQFTAPKQFSSSTQQQTHTQQVFQSSEGEKEWVPGSSPPSRQSSFRSEKSSSSSSSLSSTPPRVTTEAKTHISSPPIKSHVETSLAAEQRRAGIKLPTAAPPPPRPISLLFEGDIFTEDYSSHSIIGNENDIELISQRNYDLTEINPHHHQNEDNFIDEKEVREEMRGMERTNENNEDLYDKEIQQRVSRAYYRANSSLTSDKSNTNSSNNSLVDEEMGG